MKKYFYMTDGTTQQGPLKLSELLRMRKANQIPAETKVCAVEGKVWRPLATEARQETIAQVSLFVIMIVVVGAGSLWYQNREKDQKDNNLQTMAQSALASGSITDYEANDFYQSGLKQLDAGKYQLAVMDLDAAISTKSNDPKFFEARAKAKENLGDHAGAAADTAQATQLRSSAKPSQ